LLKEIENRLLLQLDLSSTASQPLAELANIAGSPPPVMCAIA
jgi:hypothetical protein